MSNFTEGKERLWSIAGRATENPDNPVMTRKCSYFFFLISFVVRILSISVALFSAADLRLVFEDSLK